VLAALGGDTDKLVIDLSCRRVEGGWRVAMDRWQTITDFAINKGMCSAKQRSMALPFCLHIYSELPLTLQENIALLEPHCAEFLIHAADVEGKQAGIDTELVELLSSICTIPVTYAGGGRNLQDLELVKKLSSGKIDLTIGSALDIFGGSGIKFEEAVAWNGQ